MAGILDQYLTFRHWIAVDIKYSLPIQGRLYPSHYSLLYYCKGKKPAVFKPDRLPMQICPECLADLRDYGGYKSKMNPKGVYLTDVWYDIHPVRHSKYKKRNRANELPIQLLDRVIQLASEQGDVVLDPFGGAGTTYAVAEIKGRRWIGTELGPIDAIIQRFESLDAERRYLCEARKHYNCLFTAEAHTERRRRGLWTAESVRSVGSGASGKGSDDDDLELTSEQRQLLLRERHRALRRSGQMRTASGDRNTEIT